MLRLCLVDDDALLLAGMRRTLRRASPPIELTIAESGAEALAVLEQQSIDVIISDLSMPGMDGETLLTQVQLHHPRVTRVLSTGALDAARSFDLQLVAHRVIAKPINTERLMVLIRELEEWHGQRAQHVDCSGDQQLSWHIASARRLRDQRVLSITVDVARQNPWLAMMLLQTAHAGFVEAGAPMDVRAAVHALGPTHLETIQWRLSRLSPGHGDDDFGATTGMSAPALVALCDLTREIAQCLAENRSGHAAPESCTTASPSASHFVAVAESAALLRAIALSTLSLTASDHDVTMHVALEAARHCVPRAIVEAVKESVSNTVGDVVSPALAVRWAATLLHEPEFMHAPSMGRTLADSLPMTWRDRWREHARTAIAAQRITV